MSWFKKLLQDRREPEPVDYFREGLELMRHEQYHEALTSFRLALRESPEDLAVLQHIAISYTRIGMTIEAMKTYRLVLEQAPYEVSAHYGLAFLLLREGKPEEALVHLREFLRSPPQTAEAERHVAHARRTLAELAGTSDVGPAADAGPGGAGAGGAEPT